MIHDPECFMLDGVYDSFNRTQGSLDNIQGSFDRTQGSFDRVQGSWLIHVCDIDPEGLMRHEAPV